MLAEGEKQRLIGMPLKSKGTLDREIDKYCHYHEAAGHDTEDCRHLKFGIERLPQEGHLQEYARQPHPTNTWHRDRDKWHNNSPPTRESAATRWSRRKHANESGNGPRHNRGM